MSILRNTFTGLLASALVIAMATDCHGQRPVQILYFQAETDAPTKASLYVGESLVAETELPRDNFSETFEIPKGDIKLRFVSGVIEEEKQAPEGAPEVDISGNWKKVLLLVLEDSEKSTMPIRVQAIDASDKVFGPGSIYMTNFSEVDVAGTVGDKEIELKPGDVRVIKNPVGKPGSYPVKLDKQVAGEDKPQRFIKQMWVHDEEVRQVLFILPKPAPLHATYYCAAIRGLDTAK
ncbi:MAG: hypothetical protein NWT08_12370 [Akkermansiaceae bacterium]|jgi:hypothetical protein|nr:hypothetical protein [Akkermansiaceae bacterium]MDP4646884.1 hypothetical protein [Akkermansiaceae bacterium]MDP4721544.1 hypothetical protein [Akkermansiaceae bacterium]MDP4781215.1 hypothetical protein [Akkermansiaceae bacterium]MDP4847909.1 hypothetical protein [Akkermansiaceae bacterium]